MLLPLLLLLLAFSHTTGRRCDEGGKANGSCDRVKNKRFQIRGVEVLPMWKFVLGKDIRRTQSSSTRLNFQRSVDGSAESVHAIPPLMDRDINEEEQQEQAFGPGNGRRAHGVKTVEYNQDPVDSFERSIAGDEFDDKPPLDPVNLPKIEDQSGDEEDITHRDVLEKRKFKMIPVPAAVHTMNSNHMEMSDLEPRLMTSAPLSKIPTPSPTLSPPPPITSQYVRPLVPVGLPSQISVPPPPPPDPIWMTTTTTRPPVTQANTTPPSPPRTLVPLTTQATYPPPTSPTITTSLVPSTLRTIPPRFVSNVPYPQQYPTNPTAVPVEPPSHSVITAPVQLETIVTEPAQSFQGSPHRAINTPVQFAVQQPPMPMSYIAIPTVTLNSLRIANPPAPMVPLPADDTEPVTTFPPTVPRQVATLAPSKMERILAKVVIMDNLPQVIRYPPHLMRPGEVTKPWWLNKAPTTSFPWNTTPAPTNPWWFSTTSSTTTAPVWWTTTPPITVVITSPAVSTAQLTTAQIYATPIPSEILRNNIIRQEPQRFVVNSTVQPISSTTFDGEAEVLEETELLEREKTDRKRKKQKKGLSRRRSEIDELVKNVDSSEEIGTEEEYEDKDNEKEKVSNPHESTFSSGNGPTDSTLQKAKKFLKGGGTSSGTGSQPRKTGRKHSGDTAPEDGEDDTEEPPPTITRRKSKKKEQEECCKDGEEPNDETYKPKKGRKSAHHAPKEDVEPSERIEKSRSRGSKKKPKLSRAGGELSSGGTSFPVETQSNNQNPHESTFSSGGSRGGSDRGSKGLSGGGLRGGGGGDGGGRSRSRGGGGGGGDGTGQRGRTLKGGGGSRKTGEKEVEEEEEVEDKGKEENEEDYEEFEDTPTTAHPPDYDSNIRNSMHQASLKDAKTAKYYYPPKTTIPLPTCFHNPSGYVCCNLKLNNVIEEAYQTLKTSEEFNPCNIGKMARTIQKVSQDTFGHPFESIVALSDFAQNVHFAGDMVCKLEIDGKFMLAYATPYNADEVQALEEEGGGAVFDVVQVRSRKIRRSLPIHTFRM